MPSALAVTRPISARTLLFLLVLLESVWIARPQGAPFSTCLTDCVKALGDEELDHTKLFQCSARCNGNNQAGPQQPQQQPSTVPDTPRGQKKKNRGKGGAGEFGGESQGWSGAGRGTEQEREPKRATEPPVQPSREADKDPSGAAHAHSSEGQARDPVGSDASTGGGGVGGQDALLSSSYVSSARSKDGKTQLLISDAAPDKGRDNAWEWVRVGLGGWAGVVWGNATLGLGAGSVDSIYASHVLQSFHYRLDDEVRQTLRAWYDLLAPGGRLYVSVPDFPTLCWLYLNPANTMNGRFRVLQMMMGSQEGTHQVSRSGYDMQFLGYHLNEAGFAEYERVPEFHLFDDESAKKVSSTYVSLNVIAYKSHASGTPRVEF